ncbi:alpha/beta hydrolase [Alteromonas gilva]|uniref:Alpha/beta hydrolase-fold protein n=1 Tax=Alteromonas gilva TaxID=2987522 RepID=A0ABT5L0G5_9ALTE|nr:alpha/beta hydrolase-fold protein [Alteromonas gilva]MDC8829929.1 alpha/beta hydrolase-fold protein [Alteromonas gilva]
MNKFLLLFFLVLTLAGKVSPSIAQVTWQPAQKIESSFLNESRSFRVSLPDNYNKTPSAQYPLLLILDGQRYGDVVANNARFLSQTGDIPQHVIVALDSVNRLRDFTPTDSSAWVGDGGANKFLAFIEQELMPKLVKKHRVGAHKILWGQSLAGLYVMYHLYTAPTTFDAYMVNDGALDWDGQIVAEHLQEYLAGAHRPKQFLYFNNSFLIDDVPQEFKFIEPLKTLLKNNAGEQLRWVHENLSRESHATIPLVGSIQGLRALYEGYRIPESIIFSGLEAIKTYFDGIKNRIGASDKLPEDALLALGFHTLFADPASSVDVFEYCTSLHPDSIGAWEGLSEANVMQGNVDAGIHAIEQAIRAAKRTQSPEQSRLVEHKNTLISERNNTD